MQKKTLTTQITIGRKGSQAQVQGPAKQLSLPCPTHQQFPISHLCLSTTCQSNITFCSECLFDPIQQQHIAKHKENVMAWNDFVTLCKRMSVTGRMGDFSSKDITNLVLQTQSHQQQFKVHFKQQEQLINQDFDSLVQQFTADVNHLKNDLLNHFKEYQNDLQELGCLVEKMVQEYYQNKGEAKDYNNDFDFFLKEIHKLQEQMESKQPVQFNLRRLMSNIIPLVVRANSNFQRSLQLTQNPPENQTCVSGLTIFSSFQMTENTAFNDIIQEYKELIKQKPSYKNQGLAQQIYQQANEDLQKIYHNVNEQLSNFIVPLYKSNFRNMLTLNKENVADTTTSMMLTSKTRILNSPTRVSLQQLPSFKKEKTSLILDNYIKAQLTKQTRLLSRAGKTFETQVDEELKELLLKQQFIRQVNGGCLNISNEQTVDFSSIDHTKTIPTSHKGGINCIVMIDEDYLATGSNDRTVKIWRYRTFELVKEIQFKNDVTSLAVLCRNDSSSMLVVGLYRSICLVNQSFEIVKFFEGQIDFLNKDTSIPNSQIVQQTLHQGQINGIVAACDGQSVITCSQGDNKLVQWNLIDQQQPKKYFDHRDSITCVSLLCNENYLASAGKDRNIKVYKLVYFDKEFKSGALDKLQLSLNINEAHTTEITALGSSPNMIFSMSSTGELKIWDLYDGQLFKMIKNYAGWGFKIIYLFTTVEEPNGQKKERRYASPGKGEKRALNPEQQSQIKQGSLITVCFDGSLKLYNGNSILNDSNSTPTISVSLKSLFDCHPFGGIVAIKDPITDKLELITTGNKNDNNIQIYALKQV